VADIAAANCGLSELVSKLSVKLNEIVDSEILIYSIYDSVQQLVCHCEWQDGRLMPDSSVSAKSALHGEAGNQPVLVQDVANEAGVPHLVNMAKGRGIGSFCTFPLGTTGRRIGALMFGSRRAQAFCESDLVYLGNIARLVTMMIENAQTLAGLRKEQASIGRICASLFSDQPLEALLPKVAGPIREVMGQDFTGILIYDSEQHWLRLRHLDGLTEDTRDEECVSIPASEFGSWPALREGETWQVNFSQLLKKNQPLAERLEKFDIGSLLLIPVVNRSVFWGVLALGSKHEDGFAVHNRGFLQEVAARIGAAMERDAASQQIARLNQQLEEVMGKLEGEQLCLEEEIRSSHNFDEIIGESPNLRRALAQVQTVAPSDATVLILGETGTGKELVARAIHRMSARSEAPFIKLNCAAIPTGLLESELFGHEKGAFTGAVTQKIGRLELADKGTLFLDEVGDIPLELQPKLLRVLQDQEFERLGGVRTIKVNVRLIAATNRDLSKAVAGGEFRSDLFYRLYVFPVRLPPLRERASDIPRLVRYFVQKFARRLDREIDTLPADAMQAVMAWSWPGNVRELENFIERSVLLTAGRVLQMPLAELRLENKELRHETTLHGIEREHILRVLRETGGVIAGIHGAAARLGMKRTTLQSRMQRMGINRTDYEN
jgi:formate hydrogenlyase transcriptional activator